MYALCWAAVSYLCIADNVLLLITDIVITDVLLLITDNCYYW